MHIYIITINLLPEFKILIYTFIDDTHTVSVTTTISISISTTIKYQYMYKITDILHIKRKPVT